MWRKSRLRAWAYCAIRLCKVNSRLDAYDGSNWEVAVLFRLLRWFALCCCQIQMHEPAQVGERRHVVDVFGYESRSRVTAFVTRGDLDWLYSA